ncbi:MAG: hypothetical protein KDK66_09400, partial [Deltaproteobacteria bacterium]|nr:hypothetical protein [Deltaproteobacteria bacterium]
VGDAKQSIYRFRQVDQALIASTKAKLRAQGGQEASLQYNWRSAAPILKLVNAFAAQAFPQEALSIQAPDFCEKENPQAKAQLISLQDSQGDLVNNLETARNYQCTWLAQKIKNLKNQGQDLSQVAILYRSSGLVKKLKKSLAAQAISFEVQGGLNLLEEALFIDLKNLLRFLHKPQEDLFLIALLKAPFFLLSDASLYQLMRAKKAEDQDLSLWQYLQKQAQAKKLQDLTPEGAKMTWIYQSLKKYLDKKNYQSPTRLLRDFCQAMQLDYFYQSLQGHTEASLNLEQSLVWLEKLESEDPRRSLKDLIELLDQANNDYQKARISPLSQSLSRPQTVKLLTFHAAKGLEFEVVFVVDLNRKDPNDNPALIHLEGDRALKLSKDLKLEASPRYEAILKIKKAEAQEENLRLLYVALSRAKRELYLVLNPPILNTRSKEKKALPPGGLEKILLEKLGKAAESFIKEEKISLATQSSPNKSFIFNKVEKTSLQKIKKASNTVSELETYELCPLK